MKKKVSNQHDLTIIEPGMLLICVNEYSVYDQQSLIDLIRLPRGSLLFVLNVDQDKITGIRTSLLFVTLKKETCFAIPAWDITDALSRSLYEHKGLLRIG